MSHGEPPPHGDGSPGGRPPAGPASAPHERSTSRRFVALGVALLTVAAGLAVHRLLPDTAASDIAGDALYAVLVFALAVVVAPRSHIVPAVIALAWCTAVELLQLTGWPEIAGEAFPPAMLVLGTAFDPRDLVVYAITIVLAAAADALLRALRRGRSSTRRRRG